MRGVHLSTPLREFPYLVSPKIDGIRMWVRDGVVLSKTGRPIPNRQIQALFGHLHGADGEGTVGPPHKCFPNDDVFDRTRGPVMAHDREAEFQFWVFDCWELPEMPAAMRYRRVLSHYGVDYGHADIITQQLADTQGQVDQHLSEYLDAGYEGCMLRQAGAPYKFGTSTEREGYLLKLKPMQTGSAVILAVVEQQENTNAATRDNQGYTKRSSAKGGKVGKGTFGAFLVRDLKTGAEFSVGNGPGLTAAKRAEFWARRDALIGDYLYYSFQEIGTKNAPRLPQFLRFRPAMDISEVM